ncbi:hypothetical protein [Mesorhizobium sp. KR1-2]|uniref:hypothetical protein n=1 Tax=Mesorhizobium sp. KR1-2 TaxID=3156609 RepID=UPI0032B44CBC
MSASASHTPNAAAATAGQVEAPQADASDASLPDAASLSELLDRLGAELAERAAAVERLQPLAAALAGAARTDPDALRALQGLDLTEQTLRSLAGLLADLAAATPANWRIDAGPALAAIPLADLANRLRGATSDQPHSADTDGDCEFW